MNRVSNNIVMYPARQVDVVVQNDGAYAPGGILHVVGSRSDAVRLASVISALRPHGARQAIAHVTSDDGAGPSPVYDSRGVPFTERFDAPRFDTEAERTARVLVAAEAALLEHRPQLVVLTGDSDATLAFALAASKLGIEIARVGAGLRTGDFSDSHEINRVLIDRLADVLFTDAQDAVDALGTEGIAQVRVTHTGNPAIDLLRRFGDVARDAEAWRRLDLVPGRYLLVTLHRPENMRGQLRVTRIADALAAAARRMEIVMPMHPATRAAVQPHGILERLEAAGIRITGPLGYIDFVSIEQTAGAILTDSGGVQDEASALGVRCYTMRRATERVATLTHGTNVLLGDDPTEIAEIHLDDAPNAPAAIPLWDGHSGDRIAAELSRRLTLELAS